MENKEELRCPWCGCIMELGYLYAGNESIRWVNRKPGAVMWGGPGYQGAVCQR